MSFNLQFNAKDYESAEHKIQDSQIPDVIKSILLNALKCVKTDLGVSVIAMGHLYNGEPGNYQMTTVQITVTPLIFAKPRHAKESSDG